MTERRYACKCKTHDQERFLQNFSSFVIMFKDIFLRIPTQQKLNPITYLNTITTHNSLYKFSNIIIPTNQQMKVNREIRVTGKGAYTIQISSNP